DALPISTGGATYSEYFLYSAPAPRYCGSQFNYSMTGDSLWGDEEWSSDLPPLDTTYTDPSGDIDWPELEELRRRIRAGDPAAAGGDPGMRPPLPGDPTTPQEGVQPQPGNPPQPAEGGDAGTPEDDEGDAAEEPEQREPPRIRGEPVDRDESPATPPPPAQQN